MTGTLKADGQIALFIDQLFAAADTSDFSGSVRCMAAEGGMFTAVALEMDAANRIFTTLPVVPLDSGADSGESMLNFAHFANGEIGGVATSSDLVFVNVATSAVVPAIYFYDRDGDMIDAGSVVDVTMDGVEIGDGGALMVTDQIPPMGEMTISTNGMGDGVVGSVRVVSDGPIGGVLRFDFPNIGVAGVGASEAVNAAIFPARRMAGGINTGAAIRNMEDEAVTVTCVLMQDGDPVGRQGHQVGCQWPELRVHQPDVRGTPLRPTSKARSPAPRAAGMMFTGRGPGDGFQQPDLHHPPGSSCAVIASGE